jgi:TrmH family RNA methyltransferase
MGAHFQLPILQLTWESIQDKLSGLEVFLAAAEGDQAYGQADFRTPLALIIGSEAHGPSPQARRLTSSQVYIPMPGGGESLNAAAAASILIFEVVRQRSKHQG